MNEVKPFPNLDNRNTPENVPQLPWFVCHDEASDCPPHTNSGLAKIDTGRENDWTIARLLEWPTAKHIVRCVNHADKLAEALRGLDVAYDHKTLVIAKQSARAALAAYEAAQ